MKIYVQSWNKEILNLSYGTVYNMFLHNSDWLNWIKENNKPFLLVHGGFQGNMSPVKSIVSFALQHNPDLIIAPDIYRDQANTTKLTRVYCEHASSRLIKKTAAVLQCGLDYGKIVDEYDQMGFKWLAIPSDSTLIDLIDIFKEQGWNIHILGYRCGIGVVRRQFDSIDLVVKYNNYHELRSLIGWKSHHILTE